MITWLADELLSAGLKVVEMDGWKTRQANSRGFHPSGQMIHHTADAARTGQADLDEDRPLAEFLVRGRSDLPGPLYQLLITRDGTIWILAAGRANHAGYGSFPGFPRNNGNGMSIGVCLENNGVGESYTGIQYVVAIAVSGIIARKISHKVGMIPGHKEYSADGKIDPAGIDMNHYRGDVLRWLLGRGPAVVDEEAELSASLARIEVLFEDVRARIQDTKAVAVHYVERIGAYNRKHTEGIVNAAVDSTVKRTLEGVEQIIPEATLPEGFAEAVAARVREDNAKAAQAVADALGHPPSAPSS